MTLEHRNGSRSYVCVLEKTDTGYSGFVPDLASILATGRTKNDVLKGLSEGLQVHSKYSPLPTPTGSLEDLAQDFAGDEVEFAEVQPSEEDEVSRKLNQLFSESGLTHKEVAQKLNVSRAAVSRLANPYYHGHSLDTLRRVSQALGYEVEVSFKKIK